LAKPLLELNAAAFTVGSGKSIQINRGSVMVVKLPENCVPIAECDQHADSISLAVHCRVPPEEETAKLEKLN
jgi:hypothetical protein